MLRADDLKDLLHREGFTRTDKLLLCLSVDVAKPKAVAEVVAIAAGAGLRAAKDWNVSSLLSRSGGHAVRGEKGWELNGAGRARVKELASGKAQPAPVAATALRTALSTVSATHTAAFVREAIECVEHKLYRAAVVLSWVGALALLYDHVVGTCLAAFNIEAKCRDAKWRPAKNADDLARMKEADFLEVLGAISVVGKSVKEELKQRLNLRNACGHPNSFTLGESAVAHHVEILTLNVFSKF